MFPVWILYNGILLFTAKSLGTDAVIITRVLCINLDRLYRGHSNFWSDLSFISSDEVKKYIFHESQNLNFLFWSFFYLIYTFLGSIFVSCCIQIYLIMNSVIKKFVRFTSIMWYHIFSLFCLFNGNVCKIISKLYVILLLIWNMNFVTINKFTKQMCFTLFKCHYYYYYYYY